MPAEEGERPIGYSVYSSAASLLFLCVLIDAFSPSRTSSCFALSLSLRGRTSIPLMAAPAAQPPKEPRCQGLCGPPARDTVPGGPRVLPHCPKTRGRVLSAHVSP